MKKFIQIFEEHLDEHGKKRPSAAIASTRPDTNGNYALATAEDFHMREMIGEVDEQLYERFADNEAGRMKAKVEIGAVWIKAIQIWLADK